MYILHIANKNYSSWSLRPWVLMKELNIPFEEIMHPFSSESFSVFSPTAKVPCLNHFDTTVWDSLAITEYLAEKHKTVWPCDEIARAWARSVSAEMHSGFFALRNICGMNVGVRVSLHKLSDDLMLDIKRLEDIWSEGITKFGGPFLAGKEFTAVDAFFAPVMFRVKTYKLKLGQVQQAYYELMLSLKSMQVWENEALNEVWRDPAHEREVQQYGTIVEDHRVVRF